nr:PREDICTED: nuclear transcription factor Y subunit C-2-like [Daucus carota subsp. sativus]
MYLKKHSLPLAPIKRIMKADNDIRMIAQEANLPLFAKPCEMFIVDMTSQAWIVTEEDKRRTVQKNDIVEAVLKTNMFDFLDNIIPRHELKERILKAKNARQRASSSTDSGTHGNNASNVTGAVVQQPPPFVPGHKPSSICTPDMN